MLLHWLDSTRGLHPSACASDFWTCPQTPSFTQFTQKGCQSTGLELRIPMLYFKFPRSGSANFWRPPEKTLDPPSPPPPPIGPIYIPIDSYQRKHSEYIKFNQFDTCRPKVMLPTPSYMGPKKDSCLERILFVTHQSIIPGNLLLILQE